MDLCKTEWLHLIVCKYIFIFHNYTTLCTCTVGHTAECFGLLHGDVVQMLCHRTVTTSHTMAIKEQKQFDCSFHNAANMGLRMRRAIEYAYLSVCK